MLVQARRVRALRVRVVAACESSAAPLKEQVATTAFITFDSEEGYERCLKLFKRTALDNLMRRPIDERTKYKVILSFCCDGQVFFLSCTLIVGIRSSGAKGAASIRHRLGECCHS